MNIYFVIIYYKFHPSRKDNPNGPVHGLGVARMKNIGSTLFCACEQERVFESACNPTPDKDKSCEGAALIDCMCRGYRLPSFASSKPCFLQGGKCFQLASPPYLVFVDPWFAVVFRFPCSFARSFVVVERWFPPVFRLLSSGAQSTTKVHCADGPPGQRGAPCWFQVRNAGAWHCKLLQNSLIPPSKNNHWGVVLFLHWGPSPFPVTCFHVTGPGVWDPAPTV